MLIFFLLLTSVAAITFMQFNNEFVQKLDNETIRIKYVPSSTGTPVIYGTAAVRPTNYIFVSYDVFFEPGFIWQQGGKLPGVTGGDKNIKSTGCVPVHPNAFSFRPMWRRNGSLMLYMYSQNRTSTDRCGIGPTTHSGVLPIGRWFQLAMEMKVNNATANGFGRLFVDGVKMLEVTGIRWRGDMTAQINTFLFTTFYGGRNPTWSPPQITYSRMRNLVISYG